MEKEDGKAEKKEEQEEDDEEEDIKRFKHLFIMKYLNYLGCCLYIFTIKVLHLKTQKYGLMLLF